MDWRDSPSTAKQRHSYRKRIKRLKSFRAGRRFSRPSNGTRFVPRRSASRSVSPPRRRAFVRHCFVASRNFEIGFNRSEFRGPTLTDCSVDQRSVPSRSRPEDAVRGNLRSDQSALQARFIRRGESRSDCVKIDTDQTMTVRSVELYGGGGRVDRADLQEARLCPSDGLSRFALLHCLSVFRTDAAMSYRTVQRSVSSRRGRSHAYSPKALHPIRVSSPSLSSMQSLTAECRGWSPLAGGALTGKLSATATAEKGSRFDVTDPNNFIAHMYQDLYAKPSVFAVRPLQCRTGRALADGNCRRSKTSKRSLRMLRSLLRTLHFDGPATTHSSPKRMR